MARVSYHQPRHADQAQTPYGDPYPVGGYDVALEAFEWGPPEYEENPGLVVLQLVGEDYGSERAFRVVDAALTAYRHNQSTRNSE